VLVVARPDQADGLSQRIPLLAGRTQIDGAATAYVCENYACQLPVTEPAALLKLLEAAQPSRSTACEAQQGKSAAAQCQAAPK
jgi:uncharacterized protein YyaL (SSP411 family)